MLGRACAQEPLCDWLACGRCAWSTKQTSGLILPVVRRAAAPEARSEAAALPERAAQPSLVRVPFSQSTVPKQQSPDPC